MERKYTDMTSLDAFPSSAIYPTKVICSSLELLSFVNLSIFYFYFFYFKSRANVARGCRRLLISFLLLCNRMKRTTPWRQSLVFPFIRTTRPSPYRRCRRRPRPASCPALWTSSWTTTWWTWSNPETACRLLGPTAACRARREDSLQAPSGEAFKVLFRKNSCGCEL